ncbi:MAG TPA: DUF421 domain-containing protein [Firmicutes bacterium]|nr:DUF421 domain-containing protein [Bacillota bacterium]
MLPDYVLVIIRSVMAAFTMLILTRALGKKQVSQLNFFEYILGITVGSIAASMSTNLNNRPLAELAALITWIALAFALETISLKSRKLSKLIDGEPLILIENGKIMEEKMALARYSFVDLIEQLREKDVFSLSDVEFAVLETDGTLSVLKKSQAQPVTPADLNLSSEYQGLSVELISEGTILKQNLEQIGRDEKWLREELKKRGLRLEQVAFGIQDTKGRLYLDLYKDEGINIIDASDYEGPS